MNDRIDESTERLLEALTRLEEMAEANIARSREIKRSIRTLRKRLAAGTPLPDILEDEEGTPIPVLVTANIDALQEVGSSLRRAEAAALRAHGYTMESIAGLFGVTRQRISAILKTDQ